MRARSHDRGRAADRLADQLLAQHGIHESMLAHGLVLAEFFRPNRSGRLIQLCEPDIGPNLIVNAGLTYIVGSALIAVAQITSFFVGLTDGTPTIDAADIMSSHAGWVEVENYDEATREAWTGVAGSAGVVTNTASKAEFTISASVTVGGGFFTSGSAKSGTTGTLIGVRAFTGGDRALIDNDVLRITYVGTLTAS